MRIDKFLSEMQVGTRSEIKKYIKAGRVRIDNEVATRPEQVVDEQVAHVEFDERPIYYAKFEYYMLNKPQNVVSATKDNVHETVVDCIYTKLRNDLFPVGRLDIDTEGLMLLTNDGHFAHMLLSPKKNIYKTYEVTIKHPLTSVDQKKLENGIDIGEYEITRPAKVDIIDTNKILLHITEGKFHQVKRMLEAVGNEVLFLKRIQIGEIRLDEALASGEYRYLTKEEIDSVTK